MHCLLPRRKCFFPLTYICIMEVDGAKHILDPTLCFVPVWRGEPKCGARSKRDSSVFRIFRASWCHKQHVCVSTFNNGRHQNVTSAQKFHRPPLHNFFSSVGEQRLELIGSWASTGGNVIRLSWQGADSAVLSVPLCTCNAPRGDVIAARPMGQRFS